MERSYADLYERSRWQKAKSAFKRAGTWLWGALGLGAILGGYGAAVVNEIAPAPRVAKELVCEWREWRAEPAPGTQVTILISNLAGDSDGSQTKRVREIFLGQRGLDVRSTCRVVALDAVGGSVADAEAEALAEGRALLEDRNADLLIWGEVKKADQELSLWFVSGGTSTLGAPSYSLTEKVTLPENFQADLGAQLEAVALAQIAPATAQAGTYLVALLTPVRAKLAQVVTHPPPGLSDEQKVSLRFYLALAAQKIGEQTGQNVFLKTAEHDYRKVLEIWTRDRVPLGWAMTQNNVGVALSTLGGRESSTAHLEEAVGAFHAALEVWTRERASRDWAMTQNNLGGTLLMLGEREHRAERVEQAVVAFRAALKVWTLESAPLQWAATQNNLGNALRTLGGWNSGTTQLEEAIKVYRAALEVREREQVPLYWAETQYNLGLVLRDLGMRQNSLAELNEALAAFNATLEVSTRERFPQFWAAVTGSAAVALAFVGALTQDTSKVEEAIRASQAAMDVFEQTGDEFEAFLARRDVERFHELLSSLTIH